MLIACRTKHRISSRPANEALKSSWKTNFDRRDFSSGCKSATATLSSASEGFHDMTSKAHRAWPLQMDILMSLLQRNLIWLIKNNYFERVAMFTFFAHNKTQLRKFEWKKYSLKLLKYRHMISLVGSSCNLLVYNKLDTCRSSPATPLCKGFPVPQSIFDAISEQARKNAHRQQKLSDNENMCELTKRQCFLNYVCAMCHYLIQWDIFRCNNDVIFAVLVQSLRRFLLW